MKRENDNRKSNIPIPLTITTAHDPQFIFSYYQSIVQIPIVAVVASFMSKGNEPFFLPDVETLLHELGHALHSLLSRTRYQHLSGTSLKRLCHETMSSIGLGA